MSRDARGWGTRSQVAHDGAEVPLVVVRGTPYEMGRELGRLMREEIQQFVPAALAGIMKELNVSQQVLQEVWARSAAYAVMSALELM